MRRLSSAAVGDRLDQLARSLGLPVRPWRAGTDFWADRAETADGPAVVRSPRIDRVETSYDGVVDFGAVIEKEVTALGLMAAAGIPVPRVLGWRRGDPSWVLRSYIEHAEGAAVPLRRLGALTRDVHDIRPSVPGLRPFESWTCFIQDRLGQRLEAARRYCDLPGSLERPVTALLASREEHTTSLLHMDLRPANVCVADGGIAALMDVANCIVGDPLMELGRIRGYGLLTDEFLAGYGSPELSPALLDLYELDTALLLTVVSVEEFDDPDLHRDQATRATELAARIA